MARRQTLCQKYADTEPGSQHRTGGSGYLAIVHRDELPRPMRREGHNITRGFAVHLHDQWFFFNAKEPAIAFGRAGRMSHRVTSYDVCKAAHEVLFCDRATHGDEKVLLIGESVMDEEDELETLKRFVQGVKENPWSSHWHTPTGFITNIGNGTPVKTGVRSLPL